MRVTLGRRLLSEIVSGGGSKRVLCRQVEFISGKHSLGNVLEEESI